MKIKKILAAALLAILIVLSLAACKPKPPEPDIPDDPVEDKVTYPLPKDKKYSILFVGNSYTYYNYMPAMFKNVAVSMGYDVVVEQIIQGSHTLEQFNDPNDQEDTGGGDDTGMDLQYAIDNKGPYDYVFLQEQTTRPATDPERFFAAATDLKEKFEAVGTKTVLYETWARKDGNNWLSENGYTTKTQMMAVAASYKTLGERLGVQVSHAGLAMYSIYKTYGDVGVVLYHTDNSHPSFTGSYLAALVHFATLFGVDPTLVDFIPTPNDADYEGYPRAVVKTAQNITQEVAVLLRQTAKDVVFGDTSHIFD